MVVEEMHSSSLATLLPLDTPLFRLSLSVLSQMMMSTLLMHSGVLKLVQIVFLHLKHNH